MLTIIETGELPTSRVPGSVGLYFKLSGRPDVSRIRDFNSTSVTYRGPGANSFMSIEAPTLTGSEIRWLVPIHLKDEAAKYIQQRIDNANETD